MFETKSSGGPRRSGLRDGVWIPVLAIGVIGAALAGLVLNGAAEGAAFAALGVLGAAATAAGVRLERPSRALPWYLLVSGAVALVFGDAARSGLFSGGEPATGAGSVLLLGHLLLAGAVVLIIRNHARGKEAGVLLDASILSVGVAMAAWVVLLGPSVLGGPPAALPIPVLGVGLVAGISWAVLASGLRTPPFYLLAAALLCVLAGDALYAAPGGPPAGVAWAVAYALLGASALHPAMNDVTEPGPGAPPGAGGVAFIAASVLAVPTVLALRYLREEPAVSVAVVAGSAAVFFLALLRARLLRRGRPDPVRTAPAGRDTVLDASVDALVAATNSAAVYDAALEAGRAILARGGHAGGSVRIALGTVDDLDVVVASDGVVEESVRLRGGVTRALLRRRGTSVKQETHPWLPQTPEADPSEAEHFLAPIFTGVKLGGVIVVSSAAPLGAEAGRAVEALAERVAVALERVDATEERHRRGTEERFERLTQNVSDVIMVLSREGELRYASASYRRVLGQNPGRAVGEDFFDRVHPDDAARARRSFRKAVNAADRGASRSLNLRLRHAAGTWRDVEIEVSNALADQNVGGVVLTARDVTEKKQTAEMITHQTFYDPLTGLPNRDLLIDRLGKALARPDRTEDSVAVIFLNLDRFKLVNDSLGREAGDRLLAAVGRRLSASLRPEDTVARLSGDEFVVLMDEVEGLSQVVFYAERVVKLFEAPFMSGNRQAYTTISAGIALSGPNRDTPLELLRDADIAMQRAKAKGKSRYEVFDVEMGSQALGRLERDTEIRRAIEREEFTVFYQPKMDLLTGRLHGFEALVRWEHPERGLVPPGEFIPLAEESGLIVRIGHWVLEESCRRAKVWYDRYGTDAPAVGVNLSARQFRNPRLPELVAAVLEETRLPPDALLLEVTESAMMEDARASSATLANLKELGVRIAIDDFGTGYSSLAYLKRFPLDMLKIDRSFVNELGHDPKSDAIVEAVCALGRTLQMQVLAEGIETAGQATKLLGLGCELGQGYFFSRPLPRPGADDLLSRHPGIHSST